MKIELRFQCRRISSTCRYNPHRFYRRSSAYHRRFQRIWHPSATDGLLDRGDVERRQALGDFLVDEARGDGGAVVVEHGRELLGREHALGDEERAQLAVAVLS